jgi:hypothetical protein
MFETEREISSAESDRSNSESADSASKYTLEDSLRAFVVLIVLAGPLCGFLFHAQGHSPETQFFSLLLYTLGLFYIQTNRFLDEVPWDTLIRCRSKLFLIHAPSLAIVWCILSSALALHPYCPKWFTEEGSKGSLFEWSLTVLCLVLCFVELSIIRKACAGSDPDEISESSMN